VLGNVLYGLADTYFRRGEYEHAMDAADECCSLAEDLGDDALRVRAMNRIATVHEMRFETDAAEEVLTETLALARRIGHRRVETSALINVGVLNLSSGKIKDAVAAWESALAIAREASDLFATNIVTSNLAAAYSRIGLLEKVMPLVLESLRTAKQMRSTSGLLRGLLGLGELRLAQGDVTAGLRLFGLARGHPAAAADHLWGAERGLEFWRGRLHLDEARIAALLEAGAQLELEKVIAEVFQK